MNGDAKFRLFQFLLQMGYKEIEVSYPSASQTEYEFTRHLITSRAIPEDVTIQVMAPAREDLIRTTIESVRGAKKVILHIHLSTSPCFQDVVFNLSEDEMIALAVRCTKMIKELTKDCPDPEMNGIEWTLEFTPENFQDTTVEFGLEICEAVKAAWQPTREMPIIFNLTSTVEMAMPNIFADQVEFFCDHITERDKVCVSLHNHNDRGCAVATAELSQLAGADRVEGCLFGNGERTGNVDLVTLGMNLFTQGIDPGVDFSDINQVVRIIEELTQIPVHPRAPYAGKLVFCTFTGTHQDAIRKGYKRMESVSRKLGRMPKWRMPYLPMDPSDLGRKHEAVIRLNSQSGKGGIAWYFRDVFHVDMPRELEITFTRVVKKYANDLRHEVDHDAIEGLFRKNYMKSENDGLQLLSSELFDNKTNDCFNRKNGHSHTNGSSAVNGANGHLNGYTNRRSNGNPNADSNGLMNGGPVQPFGMSQNSYPKGDEVDSKLNGLRMGSHGVTLAARVAVGADIVDISAQSLDLATCLPKAFRQLGHDLRILSYHVLSVEDPDFPSGAQKTATFVKIELIDSSGVTWGAAIEDDPTRSSLQAVRWRFVPIPQYLRMNSY